MGKKSFKTLKRNRQYRVWQDSSHARFAYSNRFVSKLDIMDYIHHSPVADRIVECPENYFFSSALNNAGLEYELDVAVVFMG